MRISLSGAFWIIMSAQSISGFCQAKPDSLDHFTGTYYLKINEQQTFIIRKENNQLILSIPGQGQAPIALISKYLYKVTGVKPEALIEFVPDGNGKVNTLLWRQDLNLDMVRVHGSSEGEKSGSSLGEFAGEYRQKKGGNNKWVFSVEDGHFYVKANTEAKLELQRESGDIFLYKTPAFELRFEFLRNSAGELVGAKFQKRGGVDFVRKQESPEDSLLANHVSNRKNGFTRADTLQGSLSAFRSCYDVLFYHLDLKIVPDAKSISGNNLIRFKVVESFKKMQIDLYKNMKIDSIVMGRSSIPFTREFNAVFLDLPEVLQPGEIHEIRVFYSGSPQEPDLSIPMNGGFIWLRDRDGNPWIESVCQGSGASLWWPCKDHLSDKPDSMAISITVPSNLMDISNGRLRSKKVVEGGFTKYEWYVSYPIINYDVAVNIGVYTQYQDIYRGEETEYPVKYYCLPYHLDKAKEIFSQAKPMLALFEKFFGPYPCPGDGFTLMESVYPMEHQSAVSIGMINENDFDSVEMRRSMYHESAHEWWGNSISCGDMADLWIHEAFATYSEYLVKEAEYGKQSMQESINKQTAINRDPVIGVYGVNHIHYDIGDMYSKGSLMLNTLRTLIDHDSLWFSMLRGIQAKYRHQTVTTEEIITYINKITKTDYTYFFDQYLRETSIPILEFKFLTVQGKSRIQYRWDSAITGFHMPVKLMRKDNSPLWISPSAGWQELDLQGLREEDLKAIRNEFFVRIKIDKP